MQEEVALLQLVIEEEICLRELHSHSVLMLAREVGTEHVQAGEQPAASARFLVVDALLWCLHAEIGVDGSGIAEVLSQIVDGVLGYGVGKGMVAGRLHLSFLNNL